MGSFFETHSEPACTNSVKNFQMRKEGGRWVLRRPMTGMILAFGEGCQRKASPSCNTAQEPLRNRKPEPSKPSFQQPNADPVRTVFQKPEPALCHPLNLKLCRNAQKPFPQRNRTGTQNWNCLNRSMHKPQLN